MTMNKILIRKAKVGDEKGIVELRKEAFRRNNWIYTGSNKAPDNKKLKSWREKFRKGYPSISFMAIDKEKNKIIGSIYGEFKKEGRMKHRISLGWGLHPDYQGRGIGTRLLKELILEAKKRKFRRLEAEMAKENIASWKLAKKCGFNIEGTKKEAMLTDDGRYIDTYIVGKIL